MPSCARLGVAHDDDGGGAVVERAGVARRHPAALAEHGLELRRAPRASCSARGPSSRRHDGAVGQRDRDDLALEEPVRLALDGAGLGEERELVHLLARDLLELGDVLGGLAHRDVDVGQPALERRPGVRHRGRPRCGARLGVGERLVVRPGVRRAVAVARDGLDARGDEDVALARADRVGGHADRLQRARAVPVDRHAGDVVEAGEHRRDPRDVEAGLAGRLAVAHEDVLDVARVELGDLGEHVSDGERGEVVGTAVHERPLVGPPDRRATRSRR